MRLFVYFFSCLLFTGLKSQNQPQTPTSFLENKGQIIDQNGKQADDVLFVAQGFNGQIQLRKRGISYEHYLMSETKSDSQEPTPVDFICSRVDINFNGSNEANIIIKESPVGPIYNFYNRDIPVTGINGYQRITYKGIYPGTDVVFYFNPKGEFKYDFLCYYGSEPEKIKLSFQGCNIKLFNETSLSIITDWGGWQEKIPEAKIINSLSMVSRDANCKIRLHGNSVNFDLSSGLLRDEVLVIDPMPDQLWGTYFGGNNAESVNESSVSTNGDIAVTGVTFSTMGLVTVGSHQTNLSGNQDAFVAVLDSNGIPVWITYCGGSTPGSTLDAGMSVCFQNSGYLILVGCTDATSGLATSGAFQINNAGNGDGFIAKFDSTGIMDWCTYYGGSGWDRIRSVSCDSLGSIYVAGHSNSISGISSLFAFQSANAGMTDGFIAKFNSAGVRLWGTYFGGPGGDNIYKIHSVNNHHFALSGQTGSQTGISTPGSFKPTKSASDDAFIALFDSSGNRVWSTYWGGNGTDVGYAITGRRNLLAFSGYTLSTSGISTPGSYQKNLSGGNDAYLGVFDIQGNLRWATYLGAQGNEFLYDMSMSQSDKIVIAGTTYSHTGIGDSGSFQDSLCTTNNTDLFIAMFDTAGIIQFSSFFGGEMSESMGGIDFYGEEAFILAGSSSSLNTVTTPGAYQIVPTGTTDALVEKFRIGCPSPSLYWSGLSNIYCTKDTVSTITVSPAATTIQGDGISGNQFDPDLLSYGPHFIVFQYSDGCGLRRDSQSVFIRITPDANISVSGASPSFTFSSSGNSGNSFYWDFGDGFTATQATVSHTYSNSGNFSVCLTVSSPICGSDDSCIVVNVLPSSLIDPRVETLNIYPNPCSTALAIQTPVFWRGPAYIEIVNQFGIIQDIIELKAIPENVITIKTEELPAGCYYARITCSGYVKGARFIKYKTD